MKRVKVINITGLARSGTTLLGRMLELQEKVFFAGEVEYVWEKGIIRNELCSCGVPFKECRLWREIIADFLKKNNGFEIEKVVKTCNWARRIRRLPRHIYSRKVDLKSGEVRSYIAATHSLLMSIGDVTGAEYVVDSTKRINHAYLLSDHTGIDFNMLHLVRDARGVAYSCSKKNKRLLEISDRVEFMEVVAPIKSAVAWLVINALTEIVGRSCSTYKRINYEELILKPESVLKDVFTELGTEIEIAPFIKNKSKVYIGSGHTVAGNPQRFESGEIELKLDDKWKSELGFMNRLIVMFIDLPLLLRYGYRFI